MLQAIKDIIRSKKKRFDRICRANGLTLSYTLNKDSLSILEDIFLQREYADYFPFYESATIVDIGAHYGYFSIFAAHNTAASSRIYAFEPSEKNFEKLRHNVSTCQISNVASFQMAISQHSGAGELFEDTSVNNSLLDNYPLQGAKANKNTTTVRTLDLQSLISENQMEQIDFLKLDCEGAEYGILLNATAEVLAKIKVLSMEFHDLKDSAFTGNRLVEKLEENNFTIVRYTYSTTRMNLNYGRIIARRNSS